MCALSAAAALAGCHGIHRDVNAPGHIDLDEPPAYDPAQVARGGATLTPERPRDPGERMAVVSPGVYGGYGGRFGRDEGDRGTGFVGLELGVSRGSSPHSHYRDSFFVYPLTGEGASLGWTFVQIGQEAEIGPIYAEVHRFRLFLGAAVGYAFDPDDVDHGPQVSAWAGPYILRARYLLDGGFELSVGGQLKLPFVWVWSQ